MSRLSDSLGRGLQPEPEPVPVPVRAKVPATPFETPATLTGDMTFEGDGTGDIRIWIGYDMAHVTSGQYEGTGIVALGGGIGLYLKRDGKSVGTLRIELGPILQAAIAAFEQQESEPIPWERDPEKVRAQYGLPGGEA